MQHLWAKSGSGRLMPNLPSLLGRRRAVLWPFSTTRAALRGPLLVSRLGSGEPTGFEGWPVVVAQIWDARAQGIGWPR